MRTHRFLSVFAGLTALSVTGAAAAAVTPQESYQLDLTCASVAAAASVYTKSQGSPSDQSRSVALADQTLAIAKTSGGQLGVAPDRVETKVTSGRDKLLVGLRQPDPDKARAERTDLGQTLVRCALLHAVTK